MNLYYILEDEVTPKWKTRKREQKKFCYKERSKLMNSFPFWYFDIKEQETEFKLKKKRANEGIEEREKKGKRQKDEGKKEVIQFLPVFPQSHQHSSYHRKRR